MIGDMSDAGADHYRSRTFPGAGEANIAFDEKQVTTA